MHEKQDKKSINLGTISLSLPPINLLAWLLKIKLENHASF